MDARPDHWGWDAFTGKHCRPRDSRAVTDRVHLGFSVLILPLRPVAWLATQIATLQYVSGNRVILGIGSRLADEPDQPVVMLAPATPVPPMLIGGNSDVAIRRAVTHGHGWFPSLITPDALARRAAKLRELAVERGRATPSITVGGHAVLGHNKPALDALLHSLVDVQGMPSEEAAMIPVTGTPEQVAERFAAYAAAGAERLVLALDGGKWMRQCELIAQAHALLN